MQPTRQEIESLFDFVDKHCPHKIDCPCCYNGTWEAECCNGAGGCSCRGGMVDMGMCNVCNGRGYYWSDEEIDTSLNWRSISTPFLGSGPKSFSEYSLYL